MVCKMYILYSKSTKRGSHCKWYCYKNAISMTCYYQNPLLYQITSNIRFTSFIINKRGITYPISLYRTLFIHTKQSKFVKKSEGNMNSKILLVGLKETCQQKKQYIYNSYVCHTIWIFRYPTVKIKETLYNRCKYFLLTR